MTTNTTPQPGRTDREQRERNQALWQAEQAERGTAETRTNKPPLVWAEMAVQAVFKDYVTAKVWDGAELKGEAVNVAMPGELRASTWDGVTMGRVWDGQILSSVAHTYFNKQQRNAGGRLETIDPPYRTPVGAFPGSLITAAPILTQVKDDADADLWCQYREIGPRGWAHLALDMQTGAATLDGDNRWSYALSQIKYDSDGTFTLLTGGITGTGYNRAEAINSASGTQGNGVDVDTLPDNFEIKPVPAGVPVIARPYVKVDGETSTIQHLFTLANAADGEC